jgi:hypothetical protein
MPERGTQPAGARLSWDGVHRLEVLLRTRALGMKPRLAHDSTCAACGGPLLDDGMRVAGIRVHPGCLPGASRLS